MPIDESGQENRQVNQETAAWPEIDRSLIEGGRAVPPPFPLHVLPGRCRAWVEASAQGFTPVDYLAQGLLAAASAVCGTEIVVRVTPAWTEPLVLWPVLVGGPSTGKTPALAAARRLLAGLDRGREIGSVEWRDELEAWWRNATDRALRDSRLADWRRSTVVGSLRPERLAEGPCDEELAARFLYAWPDGAEGAPLGAATPDDDGVRAVLKRIAALAGTAEEPGTLVFEEEAVATLQSLLPALRQEMQSCDGAEAAWIGKGAGTIVRLAGLLALLRWAEGKDETPHDISAAATLMDAHALWAGYFLPHARAVFGQAGRDGRDRHARRAARWLRRSRLARVSREDIRVEALSRGVDAEGADQVIERLEEGGVLRSMATQRTGGRRPRRWEVNPDL